MRKSLLIPLITALLLPAAPAWAEKGIVEITSEPGGAKIYLNGQRKGTTPTQAGQKLLLELEEGEYKLEGKTDDGLEAKFDLFVPAGGIQPVNLVLPKRIHERYLDNGDGTVTDVTTKLMWMRCSVGQSWTGSTCAGETKKFNWEDAKQQTANFAGHSDWRIPSIEELRTLVYCSNGKPAYFNNGKPGQEEYDAQGKPSGFDGGCQGEPGKDHEQPTLVQSVFPNTPDLWFWSGSPHAYDSDGAWGVGFDYGGNDANYYRNGNNYRVRLVRGGQ